RFVSEEYSASTQIQGTSFNQRFLRQEKAAHCRRSSGAARRFPREPQEIMEPLIHSTPCLCASALSSRPRQSSAQNAMERFAATPPVYFLERYSASTQIQGTSFNQRFLIS
ncbi:hypothetical protein, partial [uncultured Selenomonas sp.]|uniref:hypothetical protein n=1 Tax=uncultured Selenomonas sp. TaxID=159275 RepID=UPI002589907D